MYSKFKSVSWSLLSFIFTIQLKGITSPIFKPLRYTVHVTVLLVNVDAVQLTKVQIGTIALRLISKFAFLI